MKNRKFIVRISFIACLISALALFSACSLDDSTKKASPPSVTQMQAQYCTPQQTAQSSELHNLCKRMQLLDDPNRVSYLYLTAANGAIFAEYQIIGKCSSTMSNVIPDEVKQVDTGGTNSVSSVMVPNKQLDGSYGQNEPAVFCYLDNKEQSLVEFNYYVVGFIWSSTRLTLTTPPAIVQVFDGK